EARRAPQLARGPGGQPGGRGGERPVRRGGGRGRARAPDRAAGRGAGGRRGVVGRVDPRGGGAGPRLVSRDGAERAAARALAAGSTDRGGPGAGCGPVAVRRGARERGRGRVGAAGATGTARAVPGGDGDGVAAAQARIRARLKSDWEREKRVTRLPHGRLLSAACPPHTGCWMRPCGDATPR